jgi:hypothetical protein
MSLDDRLMLRNLVAALLLQCFTYESGAYELSGSIGLSGRYYFDDAVYENQYNTSSSLAMQAEFRNKWNGNANVFTFTPFYRVDQRDEERTHGDIRQLDIITAHDNWEFQFGISKVFWGVAESVHLVDIINQTDAVESLDGEEKLGQPLAKMSYFFDSGTLQFFIMPYFRERTFPGVDGRLRTLFPVDTQDVAYESGDEQRHVDYALRYQRVFDAFDVGLSYFDGTSREPTLIPDYNELVLRQYYPLIKQYGLDLQYTGNDWLWKLEVIRREQKSKNYSAAVGGFEYTKPRFLGTKTDLGLIAEYLYDSRGETFEAPYQKDLFLGARVALNDLNTTEFLLGGYFDMDNGSKLFSMEGSSRVSNHMVINVEAQIFVDIDRRDSLYDLEKDSFVEIELVRYF